MPKDTFCGVEFEFLVEDHRNTNGVSEKYRRGVENIENAGNYATRFVAMKLLNIELPVETGVVL